MHKHGNRTAQASRAARMDARDAVGVNIMAWVAPLLIALALLIAGAAGAFAQQTIPPGLTENPVGGAVPGNSLGASSDSEMWRAVRQGIQGNVSIPDKKAGVLVQSEGDNWRAFRNGPLSVYSAYALMGIIALLAVFFLLRGRIKIAHGRSGETITRFAGWERIGHWLLAISFIVLSLTGLNLLYGRYFLPDVIGPEAFAALTLWGKYVHNYVAFAFILGLVWVFLAWVMHNFPSKHDLIWIAQGGGILSKNLHPPAKKFNAGQKMIFWLTIVGGASVALSGWALMFPFSTTMFGDTFAIINGVLGTSLPENLSGIQEQQFAQIWHTMMAVFLMCVILAHIYIGSVGMEGAFDAMGSGEVDLNWAKEHHSLWVEEHLEDIHQREPKGSAPAPAE